MVEDYHRHIANLKKNRFILGIPEIDKRIRGIAGGEVLTTAPNPKDLPEIVKETCRSKDARAGLGVILQPGETQQTLHIALLTPDEERQVIRSYGGPPLMAPRWAVNLSLDLIRKL